MRNKGGGMIAWLRNLFSTRWVRIEKIKGTSAELSKLKTNQQVLWGDGKTYHIRLTFVKRKPLVSDLFSRPMYLKEPPTGEVSSADIERLAREARWKGVATGYDEPELVDLK